MVQLVIVNKSDLIIGHGLENLNVDKKYSILTRVNIYTRVDCDLLFGGSVPEIK